MSETKQKNSTSTEKLPQMTEIKWLNCSTASGAKTLASPKSKEAMEDSSELSNDTTCNDAKPKVSQSDSSKFHVIATDDANSESNSNDIDLKNQIVKSNDTLNAKAEIATIETNEEKKTEKNIDNEIAINNSNPKGKKGKRNSNAKPSVWNAGSSLNTAEEEARKKREARAFALAPSRAAYRKFLKNSKTMLYSGLPITPTPTTPGCMPMSMPMPGRPYSVHNILPTGASPMYHKYSSTPTKLQFSSPGYPPPPTSQLPPHPQNPIHYNAYLPMHRPTVPPPPLPPPLLPPPHPPHLPPSNTNHMRGKKKILKKPFAKLPLQKNVARPIPTASTRGNGQLNPFMNNPKASISSNCNTISSTMTNSNDKRLNQAKVNDDHNDDDEYAKFVKSLCDDLGSIVSFPVPNDDDDDEASYQLPDEEEDEDDFDEFFHSKSIFSNLNMDLNTERNLCDNKELESSCISDSNSSNYPKTTKVETSEKIQNNDSQLKRIDDKRANNANYSPSFQENSTTNINYTDDVKSLTKHGNNLQNEGIDYTELEEELGNLMEEDIEATLATLLQQPIQNSSSPPNTPNKDEFPLKPSPEQSIITHNVYNKTPAPSPSQNSKNFTTPSLLKSSGMLVSPSIARQRKHKVVAAAARATSTILPSSKLEPLTPTTKFDPLNPPPNSISNKTINISHNNKFIPSQRSTSTPSTKSGTSSHYAPQFNGSVTIDHVSQLYSLMKQHYQLLVQQSILAVRTAHKQKKEKEKIMKDRANAKKLRDNKAGRESTKKKTAKEPKEKKGKGKLSKGNINKDEFNNEKKQKEVTYAKFPREEDNDTPKKEKNVVKEPNEKDVIKKENPGESEIELNEKKRIKESKTEEESNENNTVRELPKTKKTGNLPIGETQDEIMEILDGAVVMLQDLDQNRKDSIRYSIAQKERFNVDCIQSHNLQRLTRSAFTKTLQERDGVCSTAMAPPLVWNGSCYVERYSIPGSLHNECDKVISMFDVKGLGRLKETFSTLDNSVNINGKVNILDMVKDAEACDFLLRQAGANIDNHLIPRNRDLSELLTFPKEIFGDQLHYPLSHQQQLELRQNRSQFSASEDNLLLRGVNLFGEKEWISVSERYLPDRSLTFISQRYARLCFLLYVAHGIQIDAEGNLEIPPEHPGGAANFDEEAISKLKEIEEPYKYNVHRWSLAEDITILRCVPLMGRMWAEISNRFIKHRTRGHIRKRYQVLERRVKGALKREKSNTIGSLICASPKADYSINRSTPNLLSGESSDISLSTPDLNITETLVDMSRNRTNVNEPMNKKIKIIQSRPAPQKYACIPPRMLPISSTNSDKMHSDSSTINGNRRDSKSKNETSSALSAPNTPISGAADSLNAMRRSQTSNLSNFSSKGDCSSNNTPISKKHQKTKRYLDCELKNAASATDKGLNAINSSIVISSQEQQSGNSFEAKGQNHNIKNVDAYRKANTKDGAKQPNGLQYTLTKIPDRGERNSHSIPYCRLPCTLTQSATAKQNMKDEDGNKLICEENMESFSSNSKTLEPTVNVLIPSSEKTTPNISTSEDTGKRALKCSPQNSVTPSVTYNELEKIINEGAGLSIASQMNKWMNDHDSLEPKSNLRIESRLTSDAFLSRAPPNQSVTISRLPNLTTDTGMSSFSVLNLSKDATKQDESSSTESKFTSEKTLIQKVLGLKKDEDSKSKSKSSGSNELTNCTKQEESESDIGEISKLSFSKYDNFEDTQIRGTATQMIGDMSIGGISEFAITNFSKERSKQVEEKSTVTLRPLPSTDSVTEDTVTDCSQSLGRNHEHSLGPPSLFDVANVLNSLSNSPRQSHVSFGISSPKKKSLKRPIKDTVTTRSMSLFSKVVASAQFQSSKRQRK